MTRTPAASLLPGSSFSHFPIDIESAKAFGKLYASITKRHEEGSLYREFVKLQA
ncbi:hypothetical protein GMST_34820 [Geomonas silvestris]|uniref:Uncharacterized protein n=1 Tax=Geomonas silvestris TaxID=2740184 RepID=A0A6V8MMR2_9BACT|nr:hypothetical protein [Geomonas silvestris]GFO61157.1 hypothetical protein GMST_34820 [Geomonas silvestris]